MASDIVAHIISEIRMMMMMKSVPDFCRKNNTITHNITTHLSKIERVVVAEQNESSKDMVVVAKLDEISSAQVIDVLTNLFDFLNDLHLPPQRQSTNMIAASFLNICNITPPRSPLHQLKLIEKQLRVAADAAAAATSSLPVKQVRKLTDFSDARYQEMKIVGRKDETDRYVRMLERRAEGFVPVIAIQGIQGIGKTRLAKSVWDDKRVEGAFDLMIWVDDGIHDKLLYAEFVAKRIIQESEMMKKKKIEEDEKDYHQYHAVVMEQDGESLGNLVEALRGSRFFLVLDDLRNEDSEEWNKLLGMLRKAPAGGAVVVTTRSEIVAKMVNPQPSKLGGLRYENAAWALFEQVAGEGGGGGGGTRDSKIKEAKKKMVKMCGGVPAAIITMARLLSSREEAKNESEIYELKDEFMQEMKLRYYNSLPSLRLKQCFAYCSFILYKLNWLRVESLIRFWMAEGFLGPANPSSSQQPEDLGLEFIQELRRRSIFFGEENEYGIISKCGMNDRLMQDLSVFVAGVNILLMEDPYKDDISHRERVHRVLLTSNEVSNGIPKSLNKKNLRTILVSPPSRVPNEVMLSWSECNEIFLGFKKLRVLTLRDLGMKVLPDSIAELKSLRYLSLARNNLKKLPSSIGELRHLLTLLLSHCHELKELPNEVKGLVSLRHLALDGCLNLELMPSALKNLTSLQTLSHFVARAKKKNSHSGGLEELIGLNNLRGQLEILHLERLQFDASDQDTDHAYLKKKEHLQFLTLRWNHDEEEKEGSDQDQISLGHLEPHPNLQGLTIVGYEGNEFSGWLLSKFINLVKFSLYNCSKCKKLPPLDQLRKLKILQLQRLDCLEFITDDHDNYDLEVVETKPFFPSLRELEISDCPNITSWWKRRIDNNVKFPPLLKLEVSHCPKLDCMPLYPNVDNELVLICSNLKPLLETLNLGLSSHSKSSPPLSQLKYLSIELEDLEQQPPLPEKWLKNFTSLKNLCIECKFLKSSMKGLKSLGSLEILFIKNCTEFKLPSGELEGLTNLSKLHIVEFPSLKSLPEGIKNLTSLKSLSIDSCPELETLTEGIGHLKSLAYLSIEGCHKLASLPQGMINLKCLRTLRITNCPILFPRCQKETGDDWPQIKHINSIQLFGSSDYYD
ncbi:hypothetical protein RIF29_05971 [Crotalaria pallida]|uniref:NB-ARC domain-containing protein n=1 Tax=Crotalaria pallida TaxID=3830 RepID=A0AAN9J3F1_CROPI